MCSGVKSILGSDLLSYEFSYPLIYMKPKEIEKIQGMAFSIALITLLPHAMVKGLDIRLLSKLDV